MSLALQAASVALLLTCSQGVRGRMPWSHVTGLPGLRSLSLPPSTCSQGSQMERALRKSEETWVLAQPYKQRTARTLETNFTFLGSRCCMHPCIVQNSSCLPHVARLKTISPCAGYISCAQQLHVAVTGLLEGEMWASLFCRKLYCEGSCD